MVPGDSFVADERATRAARAYAFRNGVKFTARKVEGGGYRIWRVAAVALFAVLISWGDAYAGQMRATEPHACAPSLESWVKTHGRKMRSQGDPVVIGEPMRLTWDSGHMVEVILYPSRDPRNGEPALCVLMSRWLGQVS